MKPRPSLTSIEAKAFIPARDFGQSRRFYAALGFEEMWCTGELALFRHGRSSFLLQDFYVSEHGNNFKMHLLVENVDEWWRMVQDSDIETQVGVKVEPPADREWGMRDFPLLDPSGVLWRIGQAL